MPPDTIDPFLFELLSAAGPTFFETPVAAIWRAEAERRGLLVQGDALGNSFARTVAGDERPDVAVFGHVDEIGLLVTAIEENGTLLFRGVGWDPQVLVGQRVRICAEGGDVIGVIGRKPVHLLSAREKETAAKLSDLWIDVGARDADDARSVVAIGDSAVIDGGPVALRNGRLASKSLDDRVGAFVALEAVARLREQAPSLRAVAVATVQEETGFAGAVAAAERLRPRVGVAVDISLASDLHEDDRAIRGEGPHHLGCGPVVFRGSGTSPRIVTLVRKLAQAHAIPIQLNAAWRHTGTEGETLQRAGRGTPTLTLAIPCRYAHSPVETIELADVEHAVALIVAFGALLTDETLELEL